MPMCRPVGDVQRRRRGASTLRCVASCLNVVRAAQARANTASRNMAPRRRGGSRHGVWQKERSSDAPAHRRSGGTSSLRGRLRLHLACCRRVVTMPRACAQGANASAHRLPVACRHVGASSPPSSMAQPAACLETWSPNNGLQQGASINLPARHRALLCRTQRQRRCGASTLGPIFNNEHAMEVPLAMRARARLCTGPPPSHLGTSQARACAAPQAVCHGRASSRGCALGGLGVPGNRRRRGGLGARLSRGELVPRIPRAPTRDKLRNSTVQAKTAIADAAAGQDVVEELLRQPGSS